MNRLRYQFHRPPVRTFSLNRLAAIVDLRLSPALFASVALAMAGVGLLSSVVGLRSTQEGFGTITTGVITAGYYLGFLGGALLAPALVVRAGHIRAYAASASIASGAVLAHLLVVHPISWALIRVVTGAAVASALVVVESWLNDSATNETRGRLLSAYTAVTMAALGAGQLLLNVASIDGFVLFVVGSMLLSAAVVPITLARETDPSVAGLTGISLKHLATLAPIGLLGVFLGGLIQGAVLAMGAVYATTAGLDIAEVSGFMALVIFGGFVGEWPLGALSDRVDRRHVVMGAATAGAVVASIGIYTSSALPLLIAMGVFGALTFPLYPLSAAIVNDHIRSEEMVPAASRILAVGGVGALLGPLLAAVTIEILGSDGFLWLLAGAAAMLALASAIDLGLREAAPPGTRAAYAPLHQAVTALATALHPDAAPIARPQDSQDATDAGISVRP